MAKKLKCGYCGDLLEGEELESPERDNSGDVICDDCYEEYYLKWCSICGDDFEKALKADDYYFILTREAVDAKNIDRLKPGIYHAKKFPIFYGDIVFGFNDFYYDNIELVREIDINSIMRKLYSKKANEIMTEEICDDCVKRFGRINNFAKIRNNYINKRYNLHYTIFERGVIAEGK